MKKFYQFSCLVFVIAVILLQLPSCSEKRNHQNFVLDYEYILDSVQKARLNNLYSSHQSKTTNQIVLLITPGFETDSTIEAFALKKFRTMGLGERDKDNGVLIVFSSRMRQVRIATGYGTEKVLTD